LIRRVAYGLPQETRAVTNSIITVATMKGGSGKSTLASCLAVHWHLKGRQPAIVDADPQRTIARLAGREKALGGVRVVEEATDEAWKAALRLAGTCDPIIIDTPGFRAQSTHACLGITDFVLVPVKASPLDVDRMLDTLNVLINGVSGRRPPFRCVLTQTTRDSVIAKHIRSDLAQAGFPVLDSEMTNRVIYPESALWGGTPNIVDADGPAAREIAAIADEVQSILDSMPQMKQAAQA
jgi:chromosome partitioning protein